MPHEEWCDLMSTMEAKYTRKRSVSQIKILVAYKVAPDNSGSNKSAMVPHKNKVSTGVLPDGNKESNNTTKHSGTQRYYIR